MLRKNFPGRKEKRRAEALARAAKGKKKEEIVCPVVVAKDDK